MGIALHVVFDKDEDENEFQQLETNDKCNTFLQIWKNWQDDFPAPDPIVVNKLGLKTYPPEPEEHDDTETRMRKLNLMKNFYLHRGNVTTHLFLDAGRGSGKRPHMCRWNSHLLLSRWGVTGRRSLATVLGWQRGLLRTIVRIFGESQEDLMIDWLSWTLIGWSGMTWPCSSCVKVPRVNCKWPPHSCTSPPWWCALGRHSRESTSYKWRPSFVSSTRALTRMKSSGEAPRGKSVGHNSQTCNIWAVDCMSCVTR